MKWKSFLNVSFHIFAFFLLVYRPSKLSAARHLYTAKLADSPVVSCLSLSKLSVSLGPDLGSNTYLNGFRYLNMNCAWNIPKTCGWNSLNRGVFPCKISWTDFFVLFLMAHTVICQSLPGSVSLYNITTRGWCEISEKGVIKRWTSSDIDIVYQQDTLCLLVTCILSVTCSNTAHSAGFDLIYMTVRQFKVDQRDDLTLIRLPVSHKEQMFLIFSPLCILAVCELSMKPESVF